MRGEAGPGGRGPWGGGWGAAAAAHLGNEGLGLRVAPRRDADEPGGQLARGRGVSHGPEHRGEALAQVAHPHRLAGGEEALAR